MNVGRRAAPAGAFLLALAVRLTYLAAARPPFAGYYWDLSSSLLQNASLALDGARTTRFEPLYPLFLAAARIAARDNVLVVQLIQCAVASLAVVFFFLAVRLLANERTAVVASLLFAVHPLLIRHSSDLSDSALTTTTLMAFAWAFLRIGGIRAAIDAGACLGLTVLTRSVSAPLIALAPVVLMFRRARPQALSLLVAAVATIAPMLARDYAVGGSVMPARQGVNLFIGNSPYTAALMPEHSPDILQHYADATAAAALGTSVDTPDAAARADAVLSRLAWKQIAEHPGETLALKARNVWYFVSPFLVPSRRLLPSTTLTLEGPGEVSVTNAPMRPLSERAVFTAFSSAILALAVVGAAARRRRLQDDAIMWCVFLTFLVVYAVYFPASRYEAPVAPVWLFYAAAAVDTYMPFGKRVPSITQ